MKNFQGKILTGCSNRPLAAKIAKFLDCELIEAKIGRFPDREVFVEIQENITNEEIFVVQSTSDPANDNIMELLVTIDALKRGGAARVVPVIPYYGYSRQDRCVSFGSPISAKLVSKLLSAAGADAIITMELHSNQIEGFFDVPINHLSAIELFKNVIKQEYGDLSEILIASPDAGGVKRARDLSNLLGVEMVFIDKKRDKLGDSKAISLVGDVQDKDVILLDDIIDSGSTLCNAAVKLHEFGARSVVALATHGVFSGNAHEKLNQSKIQKIFSTDTILQNSNGLDKFQQISVAEIFAKQINKISRNF